MIFHSGGVFSPFVLYALMLIIRLAGPPKITRTIVEKFDHIKKFRIFSNTRTHQQFYAELVPRTSLRFIHSKLCDWAYHCDTNMYTWFAYSSSPSVCGRLCACRIPMFLNGEEICSGMDWTTLHTLENVVHWHSLHSIRIPKIKSIQRRRAMAHACVCVRDTVCRVQAVHVRVS